MILVLNVMDAFNNLWHYFILLRCGHATGRRSSTIR